MSERSRLNSAKTTIETNTETTQLRLLQGGAERPDWLLDDRTRTLGRKGIADAREVLRNARPPQPKQPAPIRKAS